MVPLGADAARRGHGARRRRAGRDGPDRPIEVASCAPPIPPVALYGVRAVAVAIGYLVPAHALLELPLAARFVAATALAFAPVFCANLVFAERFGEVATPTAAFGANLLGAMIGGVLEYSALAVGYRSLLVVAGATTCSHTPRPEIAARGVTVRSG